MKTYTISEKMVKYLLGYAETPVLSEQEDFDPQDLSGGNFGDAYDMGREDGMTETAREILDHIGVKWVVDEEEEEDDDQD